MTAAAQPTATAQTTRVLGLGLRASADAADLLASWAAVSAEAEAQIARAACATGRSASQADAGGGDAPLAWPSSAPGRATLAPDRPIALPRIAPQDLPRDPPHDLPRDLAIALPAFRADLPLVRWLADRGQPLILIPRARLRGIATPSQSPRSLAAYGTGSLAEACALAALGQPSPPAVEAAPVACPPAGHWGLSLLPARKSACGRLTLALAWLGPAAPASLPAPAPQGTLP